MLSSQQVFDIGEIKPLNRPLKVCFISTFPPEKDGVGEYLNFLLSAFRKNGFFTFYVLARTLCRPMDTMSLDSHTVVLRLWNMNSAFSVINSWCNVVTAVRRIKPDIIHIQYGPTRLYGGTIGEPFLVLMLLLRLVSKAKLVVSLHSFWLPSEAEQRTFELIGSRLLAKLFRYYYCLYFWILARVPNMIVGIVVEQNSNAYRELVLLSRSKRIVEMPHGIPEHSRIDENSRRCIRAQLGLENRFVVLLFGEIRRDKGYEKVITALYKIVEQDTELMYKVTVIIAGAPLSREDQDYLRYLIKYADDRGISQCVRLVNKYLNEKEVEIYFLASDVVMLTYGRRVGPSGVLSLALSYNVPVIINVDGRFIRKKTNLPVIIVDGTDPALLSETIAYALDPEVSNTLRKQIIDWKDKYSFLKIAKLHEDLYKRLLIRMK